MTVNLENEFENIRLARILKIHGNYDQSLSYYMDILEDLDNTCHSYPYLLFEYAVCLLESAMDACGESYVEVFAKKAKKISSGDEDLEHAWNCMENARVCFEELQDKKYLIQAHKYIGDILVFNNDFGKAEEEYQKAYDLCDSDEYTQVILEDMCDCYALKGELGKARECVENILKIIGEESKEVEFYKKRLEELE
ncbi:hypothetical protein EHP00_1879 [Ecytonucleospora hepatopenaei]|uniref:Tetratricopeptide repeat protein n=1 Tax=Ecytonucleospora hepatopenaei TaxID=646526 RepID=A0A1W0E5B2_9MICR|nr:hypothetical protein EHP00_1879 [Ecytonucleospora hepatopenaei]